MLVHKKLHRHYVPYIACKAKRRHNKNNGNNNNPENQPISNLFNKLPKYKKLVHNYDKMLNFDSDTACLTCKELSDIIYEKWSKYHQITFEEHPKTLLLTIQGTCVNDIREYEKLCNILNNYKQSMNFVHFIIYNSNTQGPIPGKLFNSGAIFLVLKKIDINYIDIEWNDIMI